jgi:hypothetical protein
LAGLRKLASLAKELGVSDLANFTEMLETARNDGRGGDLLQPIKALVDQYTGQKATPKSRSELGARLMSLVSSSGAETVAELRDKAESALLRRIAELSATASIDEVLDLATAYGRLYVGRGPDSRDGRTDRPDE